MADPPPPRRLFGAAFLLLIAFSLACIAAGAVVGFVGPRLFPARTAPALAAAPRTP